MIKLGSTDITNVMLGTTKVDAIFLGNTKVYPSLPVVEGVYVYHVDIPPHQKENLTQHFQ